MASGGARFAVVVVLLALAACAPAAYDSEITSATPIGDVFAPRLKVDAAGTYIERFDPPGAGAGLVLAVATVVHNPNAFPIVLERIDYELMIAGEVVAAAVIDTSVELAAGGSGTLRWTIDADLADHAPLWSQVVAAFAGSPLPFELEGRLGFASQTFAFTTGRRTLLDGTVLSRESVLAPRIRLDPVGSRVTLVRPDAPVVTVALVAQNPGDVGYFLSGRGLVLELNEARVAEIDLGPLPLPAGESVRTELTFLIDRARLDEAGREALDVALAGHRGYVRLLGAMAYDVLGVDSFPVPDDGQLALSLAPTALPRPPAQPDDDD